MTRQNLLDARTVSYLELIGNGRTFGVPPFQRDYSWTISEWEDLWNDILELRGAADQRHYMGSLVVQAESDRSFLVIDGQQRLATLSVFALAVIEKLSSLVEKGVDPEGNDVRSQGLRDRFIGEKHPGSLVETSRLSLNETDNGFFQDYVVQHRKPRNPRRLPKSNRLLHECFEYFSKSLDEVEDLHDDGEALANLMFETVARRFLFILITVEDELNAHTVFETLNARRLELTTTDLLKNYLFSRVRVQSDLDAMRRRWQRLLTTVTQEAFPDFLRFHLLCQHSRIRRPRLFRMVRERFRTLDEVMTLLEELENRAELFSALSDPSHEFWTDRPDAKPFIRELTLYRVRQMTPLLFAAWERFQPADFVRLLKLVSVISFRYTIVSARNPTELEPAYAKAARAVADGKARGPRDVSSLLQSIYVADLKMRQDFALLGVNTRGPRKKLARYILARLESDASERQLDPETDPGTIEHILPENAEEEWEDDFPLERQEALVYRLGNLTLLSGTANRNVGNGTYADKLAAYQDSGYALTRRVAEMAPEEWTPELLEHRQARLAERAVHLWRSDFD